MSRLPCGREWRSAAAISSRGVCDSAAFLRDRLKAQELVGTCLERVTGLSVIHRPRSYQPFLDLLSGPDPESAREETFKATPNRPGARWCAMNGIHPRIGQGHIGQLIGHDSAAGIPYPLIRGPLDAECVYRPAYVHHTAIAHIATRSSNLTEPSQQRNSREPSWGSSSLDPGKDRFRTAGCLRIYGGA
ncbi:hypothetical protein BJV78DRAFT_1355130 [Lactifluus subvellereus]|nr:hypothetical protein BJV78DRAFT_1355130 [Lactifluus subvellereus]